MLLLLGCTGVPKGPRAQRGLLTLGTVGKVEAC